MSEALKLRDGRTGEEVGVTLISDQDVPTQGSYQWRLGGTGYAVRWKNGRTVYLHREIVGLEAGDGFEVDHINRDRLDNRRENLRVTVRAENGQNLPSQEGSSRFRGVAFDKRRGKWTAQVKVNGRKHYLGGFDTEEEAAAVAADFRRREMPYSEEELNHV